MSLKEKIKNLRKRKPAENAKEKTGILDGLVVLGALAGAIAVTSEASAAPTCDAETHETDNTGFEPRDDGIEVGSWDNHCWWDHTWWDHSWTDWTDWTDWLDWSLWSM